MYRLMASEYHKKHFQGLGISSHTTNPTLRTFTVWPSRWRRTTTASRRSLSWSRMAPTFLSTRSVLILPLSEHWQSFRKTGFLPVTKGKRTLKVDWTQMNELETRIWTRNQPKLSKMSERRAKVSSYFDQFVQISFFHLTFESVKIKRHTMKLLLLKQVRNSNRSFWNQWS